MSHVPSRASLAALVLAGLTLVPAARAADDTALENAQRLFRRALSTIKDTPLSSSPDAGQVIVALRSTRDKDVLPILEKVRASPVPDNQLYAMVSIAVLMKDGKYIDIPTLLGAKDQAFVGSAIAALLDADILSVDQLKAILKDAPDGAHKAMAAGELGRKKALDDMAPVMALLKDDKPVIRYYAALDIIQYGKPEEAEQALTTLKTLVAKHDLREAPVTALMLVRAQKDNIVAVAPWALSIAEDEAADQGLRYTAVACALALKSPQAPRALADMITKQTEIIQQVKLGLISLEYANQLKPAVLEPLTKSRSTLARTIATLAQKGADGSDTTSGIVSLIKEGHPIVLEWALAYTDRVDGDRRLAIRTAIVNQATIVDNIRDRDYERAAVAAQKILEDDGSDNAGRKTLATLLRTDNRAVVEATIAGIYRAKVDNKADLILPVWDGLAKATSMESAANYAALVLAREGRREPINWLPGMIAGGTVQSQGFRALAGWYYAKLTGKTAELLNYAFAP